LPPPGLPPVIILNSSPVLHLTACFDGLDHQPNLHGLIVRLNEIAPNRASQCQGLRLSGIAV
jgi:hypothetical protein